MAIKLEVKNLPTERETLGKKTVSWGDNQMKNLLALKKTKRGKPGVKEVTEGTTPQC